METHGDLGGAKTLGDEPGSAGLAVVQTGRENSGGVSVEEKDGVEVTAVVANEAQMNAPSGDGSVVEGSKVSGSANGADSAEKIQVSGDCISLVVEVHGSSNGIVEASGLEVVELACKDNRASEGEVSVEKNFEEQAASLPQNGEDPVGKVSEIVEERQVKGKECQENEFSVGDLVWSKVKGRPWWPGKIYNASDASKIAAKHHRRDCLLVAFFGDDTFAWCYPSQLKPFLERFEEMSVQGTSVSFLGAVEEAVQEIGRFVESEMACSCVALGSQNMGIKGVAVPGGGIGKFSISQYEPAKFLERLKNIARIVSKISMLELSVFRSQLSAFHRSEGRNQLAVYPETEEIADSEDNTGNKTKNEVSFGERTADLNQIPPEGDWWPSPLSPRCRKISAQNCTGISENKLYPRKKQRSMSDLLTTASRKRMNNKDSEAGIVSGLAEDDSYNHKLANSEKRKKGKLSRTIPAEADMPDNIDVKNDDRLLERSKTGSLTRERKKSKYLSPPYTTIARGSRSLLYMKNSEEEYLKVRKLSDVGDLNDNSVSSKCTSETFQKELDKSSESKHKRYDRSIPPTPKEIQKKIDLNEGNVAVGEMLSEFQFTALDPMYLKGKDCSETVRNFFSKFRGSVYRDGPGDKMFNADILDSKHGSAKKDKHETVQPTPEGKSKRRERKRKEEAVLQSTESKKIDAVGTDDMTAGHNGQQSGVQDMFEPYQPTSEGKSGRKKRIRKEEAVLQSTESRKIDAVGTANTMAGHNGQQSGVQNVFEPPQPTSEGKSGRKKRKRKEEAVLQNTESRKIDAVGMANMKPDQPTLDKSKPKKRGRKRKSEGADGKGIMKTSPNEKSNREASSAALSLTFASGVSLPSKDYLVRVFGKFGALNESKTEVTKDSASIVYTRSSDAEEALKSSRKSSPLGSAVVSYQLQHLSASSTVSEHSENPVQIVPPPESLEESSAVAQQSVPTPPGGEAPPLFLIKQNLKSMTSMLEKSGNNLSPAVKANLEAEIHSLLKKVTTMVEAPHLAE